MAGPLALLRCRKWADLNRDFPDPMDNPTMQSTGWEQPETKAVMDWTLATGFVASANMHEVRLLRMPL